MLDIRNADGEPIESIQWDQKTKAGIEVPIKLTMGDRIYTLYGWRGTA
ncbi:hypothetical protein [Niallia sp. FSL R7-0271]